MAHQHHFPHRPCSSELTLVVLTLFCRTKMGLLPCPKWSTWITVLLAVAAFILGTTSLSLPSWSETTADVDVGLWHRFFLALMA